MTARFAIQQDLDDIEKLIKLQPYDQGKQIKKSIDERMEQLNHVISSGGNFPKIIHKIVISIDDNNDVRALNHLVLRKYLPTWVCSGMKVRPSKYFHCMNNGITDIMTFGIEYAESKGYFAYEYTMRTGKAFENRFSRMQSQIPILLRYNYFTIGYLEAGHFPKFDVFRSQMDGHVFEYDVIFKTGILKEEFRPGGYSLK